MSLLVATDLVKHFGGKSVLRHANLRVEPGEKVGIVGRNGGGKTTLLRLLEGEESPDQGTLYLAKRARLGYVRQRSDFDPGVTVRDHVEQGLAEVHRTAAEYERVGEEMAEAQGEALERLVAEHGRLSERMEFLGAWDSDRRVDTVLSGIGLSESFWTREACTLSGGEKSRTALARELVAVPDLLLLDEPTNHLDLRGIEWLENYLRELHSAVVIVSHDRRLLDNLVESIVELEFGQLERYPGAYTKYLDVKADRFESAERAWRQQTEDIKREEQFIKKHMGSQRTGEAKGRQKKLSRVERLERPHLDVRRPVLSAPKVERTGEIVLTAEQLRVSYGERIVLEGADVRVGRGERIGIVGDNGTGKSTLLKVLARRLTPDAGEVQEGHKATCGYFDQETGDLRHDTSPFGTFRIEHPKMTDGEIRSYLARFLFRGSDADIEIGALSGGERGRLALARLLLRAPTWLALDEPTNHLDLAARTALEEMLSEYTGALVCVSHDRAFLDALCTVILEVKDRRVRRFNGNYSHYRSVVRSEEEQAARGREQVREKERAAQRRKAEAAAKSAGPKKKPKAGRRKAPNPYRLEKIETGIIKLEKERDSLTGELATEEVYRNPEVMREKQFRLAELERDLDQLNAEWEELIG